MNVVLNSSNQSWLSSSATRSSSVVPVFGFGMGDVRLMALGYNDETTTTKRHHAAAIQANPVKGRQPWSPPVT